MLILKPHVAIILLGGANQLEFDLSQIYTCPSCQLETPHYLLARRRDRVGIACSRCQTISLVGNKELEQHQDWWEEELKLILSNLENDPNFDD